MQDSRLYETSDIEERNVTMALRDLFVSVLKSGAAEDPLSIVCKSIVRCVDDVKFSFYCYKGEETGQIAAIKDGVKIALPPPDVERKVVANMRRQTAQCGVAVINPKSALSLLSPALRRKRKCHTCIAMRVSDGVSRDAAVIAVFLPEAFHVTDRHCAWMALFADAASAFLSVDRSLRRARGDRDGAVKARQETMLALEVSRKLVREHLSEFERIMEDCRGGIVSLRDAIRAVERSAKSLYSLSDVMVRKDPDSAPEFRDPILGSWVKEGLGDPRVKAIVGVRGSNKSAMLHAIHGLVLDSGVKEENVVFIDFEDARFRRFKTASDVMSYLASFPRSSKPYYLFLDEVGMVEWHTELLSRLLATEGWNVWLAASTSQALLSDGNAASGGLNVFRTWTDIAVPRSRADLEKIWCQIFMRDVVSGVDHPDIRAKETLAEYYSDHLGEIKSLLEIARELQSVGRRISRSSISAYRQALIDAYLIEVSDVYDVFTQSVVTTISGRVFYTDLELRAWRFGSSPDKDATRVALNRLYLELRKKYDKVYTPRDQAADFVTLQPNGKPLLWKLPSDTLTTPDDFRGGGGKYKKTTEKCK